MATAGAVEFAVTFYFDTTVDRVKSGNFELFVRRGSRRPSTLCVRLDLWDRLANELRSIHKRANRGSCSLSRNIIFGIHPTLSPKE
jgi:hypothetical protein